MSFPFELVTKPDAPPFACTCRVGTGPFIKTRQLVDGGAGELFVCKDCFVKMVAIYGLVPLADVEAKEEQLQIAIADRLSLQAENERLSKELATDELQRLRDALEETCAERDAVKARAYAAERENAKLQSGDAASTHFAAVSEVITAALAPATATKEKAA